MPRSLLASAFWSIVLLLTLALPGCGGDDAGASGETDKPQGSAAVMAKFQKAWNDNSSVDLEATYAPSAVGELATAIDTYCARYGWDVSDLPKLGAGSEKGAGKVRQVTYPMGTDSLQVDMEEIGGAWFINKIEPQVKLDLRDINELVNDFMTAWNASEYDGVYKCLTPTMYDKKSSFERLFKKREWDTLLPAIESPTTTYIDDYQQATTFKVSSGGELKCKWIVEGGRWGLRTLRPPRN